MPTKLDQHTSPAKKILGLYSLLLFSGERYSLSRLAGILRCSKQTIMRMIEEIEKSREVTIETEIEDGQRWYRIKTTGSRPKTSLTPKSIQQLVLCRDMVWQFLPAGFREELDRTISRATMLLPDFNDRSEALASICDASIKGSIDYSPYQEALEALISAIHEKHVCEVEYLSGSSGKPKTHSFVPLKLISYREAFYVEGIKVHEKGTPDPVGNMTMAVHRIRLVTATRRKHSFTETDLEHAPGFGLMHGDPFRVKVHFQNDVAQYVKERKWSDDQVFTNLEDGGVALEFTARSWPEVISWVFSFGSQAEIIEPEDIRTEVAAQISQLYKKYCSTS